MTTFRIATWLWLVLAWTTAASSQAPAPDQKTVFAAYVNSPSYRSMLEEIINAGEAPTSKAQCPQMKIVEWDRTSIVEQPTFVRAANNNYEIDTGAWVGLAILERCGSRVTRRVLLRAEPGLNRFNPTLLLPGDFRGNLKLEMDAKLIVLPMLSGNANCGDFASLRVLDIKAHGPPSAGSWSETWSAIACGSRIEADVVYTPIAGGMNVTARNFRIP